LKRKPLVGVSACLLGEKVRFDGGHKRSLVVTDTLARFLEFRPYCPETAIGLGAPRQPMRLVRHNGELHAVGVRNAAMDFTQRLNDYAVDVCRRELSPLHGFILKKASPSCGMERVKVYDGHFVENGVPEHAGTGLFAQQLMRHDPLLPLEEEGRLTDARLRENFLTRVLVYADWKQNVMAAENRIKALVHFHTRHKYLLLAHNQAVYRSLGRLVASPRHGQCESLLEDYIFHVMTALKTLPTRASHSNVLLHMAGFFKRYLQRDDKQELLDLIARYREAVVPIASPLTLLQHYQRLYPSGFLQQQYYFQLQHALMAC
jgi:uncharacterized protein YbgA (DUF1722 family)/uncharacterized protein YbbK (DUF523 family)